MFINTFKHLRKILTHKFWVFLYCCKAGLFWQGLKHDMSKFSPTEFWESVKYYQGSSSPIDACKKDKGYSLSWQHHKGRNPHHYEHWTDNYDKGTESIEMPYKYAVEMFCDYIGAARAYLGKNFSWNKEMDWWNNKKHNCCMNLLTKMYITYLFIYARDHQRFPTKMEFKVFWEGLNPYRWELYHSDDTEET